MSQSHARPPGSVHRQHPIASTSRRNLRTPRASAEPSIFSPRLSHSVASSTTSNASNVSRFSLSTSFIHLTARDVAFFDNVVDLLPPGADDFASLKKTYNQLRSDRRYDVDEDKDAFLWDTLLKLIQVRGRDWSTRWDAVRMAIGLETRIISESERERTDVDDDDDDDVDDQGETSDSETKRDQQHAATTPARASTTRAEIETLRKRMAMLTAEAGSLVGTIARKAVQQDGDTAIPPVASILASREGKAGRGVRDTPGRQLRFAEEKQQEVKRNQKATFVESASDEEGSRMRAVPQRRPDPVATTSESRPAAAAQRQFDEVVARSRSEREAQKRAQEEQQEAELERRLLPLLVRVERKTNANLARKCFTWWGTSLQQRIKREAQMRRAREVVNLAKALSAWKLKLQRRREKMRGAEKVDVVRCKLRAWRVWRRNLQQTRHTRREEKRSLLKGAFVLTRKKVEQRVVKEAFLRWRIALMERRTAVFRTQHLVQGAFSLWRLHLWRIKSLKDKENAIASQTGDKLLSHMWTRWIEETRGRGMIRLAERFHSHRLMQRTLALWTTAREGKTSDRRRGALADRWRGRRSKKAALQAWQVKARRVKDMQHKATEMQNRHLKELRSASFNMWILREREQLFVRVKASSIKSQALVKWVHNHRQMTSRLKSLENRLSNSLRIAALQRSFHLWREVTSQSLMSQRLASKRDHRRVKTEALIRWRQRLKDRQTQLQRAEMVDAALLRRQMWSRWAAKHIEVKGFSFESKRNGKALTTAFTYWKARSAEKRQERIAVGLMKGKIEARIQRACLERWTSAVIERRSLILEAGERRDGLLLQQMWVKWIDACLRHEDLLNLSKSFLDVKKEDSIRRSFVKWTTLARSIRVQRERVEYLLQQKKRATATKVFDQWYDRYVEATLRPLEYEALLQRQRSAMSSIFARWKSSTRSLPAIQLDQARRKSHAFFKWQAKLPLARLENKALQRDRLVMQEKGFHHWYAATKAKRALRAAARFGGPSAVRLGAVAHLRQRSGGNPFGGGTASSSSPDARIRYRPAIQRKLSRPTSQRQESSIPTSTIARRSQEQGSLRESDLVGAGGSSEGGIGRNGVSKMSDMPPALQRWMQGIGQDGRETTLDNADASSEPPSSVLDYRYVQRRDRINRTPSPPASQAYSEATMRVKNSPRRQKRTSPDAASRDWLRLRRREQSKSMIIDG
jgi:protein SFI1